jgi:hypothetical protein
MAMVIQSQESAMGDGALNGHLGTTAHEREEGRIIKAPFKYHV